MKNNNLNKVKGLKSIVQLIEAFGGNSRYEGECREGEAPWEGDSIYR